MLNRDDITYLSSICYAKEPLGSTCPQIHIRRLPASKASGSSGSAPEAPAAPGTEPRAQRPWGGGGACTWPPSPHPQPALLGAGDTPAGRRPPPRVGARDRQRPGLRRGAGARPRPAPQPPSPRVSAGGPPRLRTRTPRPDQPRSRPPPPPVHRTWPPTLGTSCPRASTPQGTRRPRDSERPAGALAPVGGLGRAPPPFTSVTRAASGRLLQGAPAPTGPSAG